MDAANRRAGWASRAMSVSATTATSAIADSSPRIDTACAMMGVRSSPNSCGHATTRHTPATMTTTTAAMALDMQRSL